MAGWKARECECYLALNKQQLRKLFKLIQARPLASYNHLNRGGLVFVDMDVFEQAVGGKDSLVYVERGGLSFTYKDSFEPAIDGKKQVCIKKVGCWVD